jgi:hypothetical protein
MKIEGSVSATGSGSISQRHRSADPDPHQNVMDPQHCVEDSLGVRILCRYCTLKFKNIRLNAFQRVGCCFSPKELGIVPRTVLKSKKLGIGKYLIEQI